MDNNNIKGRRIIKASRPKPCSAATLSASLQPTVELDDATATAAAAAMDSKPETPIGEDYTPQPSTVAGLVDRQSISSVWKSIMIKLKTLDHPLPWNVTPATEDEVRAAETRMGYPMPPPLKEFYSLTNGIKYYKYKWLVPYDVSFPRIETFHNRPSCYTYSGSSFQNSMEMWILFQDYMCMDNFSGGLLYEWDMSFDSQCGDVVVANSLAEYLQRWDDGHTGRSAVGTLLLHHLTEVSSPFQRPGLPDCPLRGSL